MPDSPCLLLVDPESAINDRLQEIQSASQTSQFTLRHVRSIADASEAIQETAYDLVFYVDSAENPLNNLEPFLVLDTCPPVSVIMAAYDESIIMQMTEYGLKDFITVDQFTLFTIQRSLQLAYYARRQQVEQFRYMLDRSTEGVLVLDNDGQVLAVNHTAEKLFDRPRKSLMGAYLGVPLVTQETHEVDILTQQEGMRIAEMRVGRIEWQGHEALLASLHDITERKRMEKSLKETDILLRSILDALQMHIAVVDSNGVIINVNKAWIRFSKENGDEDLKFTGIGVNYFDVIRRSSNGKTPKSLRGMMAVLNGDLEMFELKYPCHSPDEERWFLMRVTPVPLDLNGDRQGLVISHINITLQHDVARRQVEQAIRMEYSRYSAREQEAFTLFNEDTHNFAGEEPLSRDAIETSTNIYHTFGEYYGDLLEKSLDRRAYKVEHDISANSRALASQMGRQMAKPRDLVKLHMRVLEEKKQYAVTAARQVAYADEGRLLILEVMGYLASFYRDTLIADLELRSM